MMTMLGERSCSAAATAGLHMTKRIAQSLERCFMVQLSRGVRRRCEATAVNMFVIDRTAKTQAFSFNGKPKATAASDCDFHRKKTVAFGLPLNDAVCKLQRCLQQWPSEAVVRNVQGLDGLGGPSYIGLSKMRRRMCNIAGLIPNTPDSVQFRASPRRVDLPVTKGAGDGLGEQSLSRPWAPLLADFFNEGA